MIAYFSSDEEEMSYSRYLYLASLNSKCIYLSLDPLSSPMIIFCHGKAIFSRR
jgi:hypothetical protein